MQLYGNGVTKNFLAILDDEIARTAKSITRLFVLAFVIALLGLGAYFNEWWLGTGIFAGTLLFAVLLGLGWGHFVSTYRYQVSIRQHWNRWMRFSISCISVRECYAKVHGKRVGPNLWWTSTFIAILILTHLVVPLFVLNEAAGLWNILPLFLLDATMLGFVVGVRWRERLWYGSFRQGVNELLQEGTIGVWGVY